jgi:ribosomal protein L40E
MTDAIGAFVKGLSAFLPQDDPDVKVMAARSELERLQSEETALYAQIGREALRRSPGQYPEQERGLAALRAELFQAQEKIGAAQAEKDARDAAKRAADEAAACPSCGTRNSGGTKFCQECGARLSAQKCARCGAALPPGARFCGECGTKM